MISIASLVRAPRVFMSLWSHSNSSGIHDRPTPMPIRPSARAAIDDTVLATSSGSRMPSFRTLVKNLMRSVTAAMAGMATKGSRNGVSGSQNRPPSAV